MTEPGRLEASGAGADGTTARLELVVFDLDGVLVDSERLAVAVEARVLAELGWPISEAEVVARFVGRSAAAMHAEVERELGRPVDWDATFAAAHRRAFEEGLEATPGVTGALARIAAAGLRTCVASSSRRDAIAYKLARTGLADAFGTRVFGADDVANAKPAPDVFLLAAATLGVDPTRCAVVEDSPAGVAAGLAAGMAVFAYDGGLVGRDRLVAPGVTVFDDMAALPPLLGAA